MKLPLVLIAVIINGVCSSSISSYVRHVCGGENKCIVEGNSTLPKESCCRPCECDHICLEKRTCCQDIGFSKDAIKNVTMQKCLPSVKASTFIRDRKYFDKYYTRATCPDTYANNQIRYNCESNEPKDFEDLPFVSSKDGNIVYKNRHCAVCHGEEGFITWGLKVDIQCMKRIFTDPYGSYVSTNISYIKEQLMNYCSISFKRPAITDIRYTICHEKQALVTSCKKNLSPDNITAGIENLCLNDVAALTFFHNYKQGKGYKNVYCYLCNKEAAVTCDLDSFEKNTESLIFLLNGRSLKEIEMEDDNKGTQLCGDAEVFDTFFGKCRRIVCSAFSLPIRGACTSLVLSSTLNYAFDFQVFLISQRFWKNDEFLDFLRPFHKSLLRKLGLGRCSTCSFSYMKGLQNSTNSFYLQLAVTTTDQCALDLVLSLAASLEKKVRSNQNLTYVIENVDVLIKYIWSNEEFSIITAGTNIILKWNTLSCLPFSPARFKNCQKVTLTADEYNSFTNKSKIEEYQTAENQHGDYEICYDDYKELVNNLSSNGVEGRPSHTLAVVSVVLMLVFLKYFVH